MLLHTLCGLIKIKACMNYYCCTERRRNAIRLHPTLNGIDYLEVVNNSSDPLPEQQTVLQLHFLKSIEDFPISPENILIKGGERIKDIEVVSTSLIPENILEIRVSQAGDFSEYELCLVIDNNATDELEVLDGIDALLARLSFSFKVNCPSDFDCKTTPIACNTETTEPPPNINYLAKDYASFRQLMYDRMALLIPNWQSPNPASLESTLVELLAYTGDYLSYRQDAITTEAYLGTARKRVSVKRHARLVDYHVHDGCNARTWLHLQVAAGVNGTTLAAGSGAQKTKVVSRVQELPTAFRLDSKAFETALKQDALIFEFLHDIDLYEAHNTMQFHTYGEENCCLPKGATQATLLGEFLNLEVGNVLIFAEVRGPETGHPQDANPAHRHAVRLTEVSVEEDINVDFYLDLDNPPASDTLAITKISWHTEDALPFPLCISEVEEAAVSVAYGNNVLVDHGLSIDGTEASLQPSQVPNVKLYQLGAQRGDHCKPETKTVIPARFRPVVQHTPLTFAAIINLEGASATHLMQQKASAALPTINLEEIANGNEWSPQQDLLIDSSATDRHFVVDIEADGKTQVRFGDDKNGMRPNVGMTFRANYRIGNGLSGNVGADALTLIASNDAAVVAALSGDDVRIWNPLAAVGGTAAETMEEVKQYAPEAFRTQERAVVAADYEHFAKVCSNDVQRASAKFRWTGSWRTVFVSVDRLEGREVDADFEADLITCLDKYRMAGMDLEIDAPHYVSLALGLEVCVQPDFLKSDVQAVILDILSSGIRSNGKRGFFHPDNFSFGATVYLSNIYAVVQAIQGVQSVTVSTFQRQGDDNSSGIDAGKLEFGRQEIARLDNNPNFPERGRLALIMQGGR